MRLRIGDLLIGAAGDPVVVSDWDRGNWELDTSDTPVSSRPGVAPGPEFRRGENWVFSLTTDTPDLGEARAAAAAIAGFWAQAQNLPPGEMLALDFQEAPGQPWLRVYGRPRKFATYKPTTVALAGAAKLTAEFKVMDPLIYSGVEQQAELVSARPNALFGFVFPVVFPLVMEGDPAEAGRSVRVVNGGGAPAPVRARFHGPAVDPILTDGAVRIRLRGAIAPGSWAEVDTRTGLVYDQGGRVKPEMLHPRDRILEMRLPVGATDFTVSAGRGSNEIVRAELFWRDTHNI